MADWNWQIKGVEPQEILKAARALRNTGSWYEVDITPAPMKSAVYLQWARDALSQATDFGYDAALCYAKRAVCRELDWFLICNHLGNFLRASYPQKIELLSSVGFRIPDIVHELIIDPRNYVEHEYSLPTRQQAKRAIELTELFIRAIADEREWFAIVTLGSSISIEWERRSVPGNEFERVEFGLTPGSEPMLLIDDCARETQVLVLYSPQQEVITCRLRAFKRNEAIELAKLLRRQRESKYQSGYHRISHNWLPKLKADIGLASILA